MLPSISFPRDQTISYRFSFSF